MLFKFTLSQFNFKYVYLGISILVFKIYFKSRHAYTPLVVKTGHQNSRSSSATLEVCLKSK